MPDQTVNLTRGIYRRLYSGMRTGKRINAVSVDAALLFWHLHCAADDFGNLPGDPGLCRTEAAPLRRGWTNKKVANWLGELAGCSPEHPLIRFYEADGERYIHISDFLKVQPANRAGRRYRKYPESPFEAAELDAVRNPEESGGTLRSPEESQAPQNHTQSHTHPHPQVKSESETQNQAQPQNHAGSDPDTGDESGDESGGESGGDAGNASGVGLGGGVFSVQGGGGAGGLGGGGGAPRRADVADEDQQVAVQSLLAKAGVTGDVQRELFQRRDITPEIVEREWADIKRAKNIDDPAAVLVHRLRSKKFGPDGQVLQVVKKIPPVRFKKTS